MSPVVRNVLIILAIAAAISLLPGGDDAADLVGETLRVGFLFAIGLIAVWLYRNQRFTLMTLDDRFRGVLYVALAAIVWAAAGAGVLFDTGLGTLLWLAVVAAAVAGLVAVFRHWRALA